MKDEDIQKAKNYIFSKVLNGDRPPHSSWESFCNFIEDCNKGNTEALEVLKVLTKDNKKKKV